MSKGEDNIYNNNPDINNEILKLLNSMTPEQFALFACSLGTLIAENLTVDEQNLLGLFLTNIGFVITTIASRREISGLIFVQETDPVIQIRNLRRQLDQLENQFNNL